MRTLEDLRNKRDQILAVARKHGAKGLRVFGSVLRGEAGGQSDVDFLVDFEPDRSLLDMSELKLDLEELLGVKVDLVTETSLYWLLRRRILNEAQPL